MSSLHAAQNKGDVNVAFFVSEEAMRNRRRDVEYVRDAKGEYAPTLMKGESAIGFHRRQHTSCSTSYLSRSVIAIRSEPNNA